MKVLINFSKGRFGGAIQVAASFIEECKFFPEHEYHVLTGPGVGAVIDEKDFPQNFFFHRLDFGTIGLLNIRRIQKTIRELELKIKPEIIFSNSGPSYYSSIAPQINGFNLPLFIYPESPYLSNLTLKRRIRFYLKKKIQLYFYKKNCVAIVVQTNDVNKRVRKVLNTKNVFTVTNNHNHFFLKKIKKSDRKLPVNNGNIFRFLTITTYYPHKNLEIIPQIVEELQSRGITNVQFVLTLKEKDFIIRIGKDTSILNIGPITPQECPALYSECDALFLPTLAECFSASYPEAMVMGKPIITTDLGFAKSICGNAALYFEPKNAKSAADRIVELINDSELQKNLQSAGYLELKKFDTPRERARKYLEICKKYATNVK